MPNRDANRETTLRQVASLELLTLVGPLIRQDRDLVYVEDEQALYCYDKDSSATADGLGVVAPESGTGRWFRSSAKVTGFEEFVQAADILNPSGLTPTKGQRWLIRGTGAGGWSGKDNHIAEYVEGTVTEASSWRFVAPVTGVVVADIDEQDLYLYTGSQWEAVAFSGDLDLLISGVVTISAAQTTTITAATLGGSYGGKPAFAQLMTSGDGTASRVETAIWSTNDLVITLDAASTGAVDVSYFVDARA